MLSGIEILTAHDIILLAVPKPEKERREYLWECGYA